jgi:hypothetical protein
MESSLAERSAFGYLIPAGQRGMTRCSRLVSLLRVQGIEVGRTTSRSN